MHEYYFLVPKGNGKGLAHEVVTHPRGDVWMLTSWVWLTLGSWKWSITSLCSWVRGLELLRLYPYCILRAEPVQLMDLTDGGTEAHSKAVMCPGKTMPEQEVAPRSLLWFSCSCAPLNWLLQQQRGGKKERVAGL